MTLTGNIHWGRENLEGDLEETIRNRFIQMSKYLKLFSHKSNIHLTKLDIDFLKVFNLSKEKSAAYIDKLNSYNWKIF